MATDKYLFMFPLIPLPKKGSKPTFSDRYEHLLKFPLIPLPKKGSKSVS